MITFIQPTTGRISSGFGAPRAGHTHAGIDYAAPTGTPVYASASGVVNFAGWLNNNAGNSVKITHGPAETKYFHLSSVRVSAGQRVSKGDLIGAVGATGNASGAHLHFEILSNGVPVNPAIALRDGVPGEIPLAVSGGALASAIGARLIPDERDSSDTVQVVLVALVGILFLRLLRG